MRLTFYATLLAVASAVSLEDNVTHVPAPAELPEVDTGADAAAMAEL